VQVVLTGAAGTGVGRLLGWTVPQSLLLGMLVALSSTAVVLKTLGDKGQTDGPHGRNTMGILIFQDIVVVPMMLVLPLLATDAVGTDTSNGGLSLGPLLLIAVAVGLVGFVVVMTRWVAPRLLYEAARSRSADVFLLVVVTICFAVAALSSELGLSLALGAFLAGLIISESDYSHQALSYVLPFRNLLMSLFFVSIGMLLDPRFLADHWWIVILASLGLILAKTITGTVAVLSIRYPLRAAVTTGLALGQVGEFSFVLAAVASTYSLLPSDLEQSLLAVAVITMAVTPIVAGQTERVARLVDRVRLPLWLTRDQAAAKTSRRGFSDHLLIVGYGLNGRNLARVAREFDFAYAVVELNPQTVREETARNEPILFGDATNEAVLTQAGAQKAKAAAVVIGDPAATRGIVAELRRLNPCLHIIARTRFVSEVQPLYDLGANEVVPEEFETSVEIFRLTAGHFDIPSREAERMERLIREDHYAVLREAHEGIRRRRARRGKGDGASCAGPGQGD
jgi:CPA2 family monovalent cation:H+ antiporter-2